MFFVVLRAQEKIPIFDIRKDDVFQVQIHTEIVENEIVHVPVQFQNLRTNEKINFQDQYIKFDQFKDIKKSSNLLLFHRPSQTPQLSLFNKKMQIKKQKINIFVNSQKQIYQQRFISKQYSIHELRKLQNEQNCEKYENKDVQNNTNINSLISIFNKFNFRVESIQKNKAKVYNLMKNDFVISKVKKIKKFNQF